MDRNVIIVIILFILILISGVQTYQMYEFRNELKEKMQVKTEFIMPEVNITCGANNGDQRAATR